MPWFFYSITIKSPIFVTRTSVIGTLLYSMISCLDILVNTLRDTYLRVWVNSRHVCGGFQSHIVEEGMTEYTKIAASLRLLNSTWDTYCTRKSSERAFVTPNQPSNRK
jgi:hypothetical protein